jgi:hypothetical protein
MTLGMGALVTLMCSPPVRRALRFVTEPEMKWAFRQDAAEQAPRR